MSVRKREWLTRKGESKEAWVVDYVDQHGKRHIKTFKRKKDADRHADQSGVDVRAGIHTAESSSITVKEACVDWLRRSRLAVVNAAPWPSIGSTSTATSCPVWAR